MGKYLHTVTLTNSSTAAFFLITMAAWHGGAYFLGRGEPIRKGWAILQHEDWNWTFHWKPPSHLGKNLSYQIWLSQSAAYVGWVNDPYMSSSWRELDFLQQGEKLNQFLGKYKQKSFHSKLCLLFIKSFYSVWIAMDQGFHFLVCIKYASRPKFLLAPGAFIERGSGRILNEQRGEERIKRIVMKPETKTRIQV